MNAQEQAKFRKLGWAMLVSFFALLIVIFMPVFPGKVNGLDYMDNLFNMISKGSSYFIPEAIKKSEALSGKGIEVKVKYDDDKRAAEIAKQVTAGGAQATVAGKEVTIKGDAAQILKAGLADADLMFKNEGKPIADKYGFSEKQAVYNWHFLFKKLSADLTKQEKFNEAKAFDNAQKRGLEPAYNYYGVKAENWKENMALVIFALAFYVIYTLWYGFGLMWLFEGYGMQIGH